MESTDESNKSHNRAYVRRVTLVRMDRGRPSLPQEEANNVRAAMAYLLEKVGKFQVVQRAGGAPKPNRTALARELGISQSAVSQILAGTNRPASATAARVAELFGLTELELRQNGYEQSPLLIHGPDHAKVHGLGVDPVLDDLLRKAFDDVRRERRRPGELQAEDAMAVVKLATKYTIHLRPEPECQEFVRSLLELAIEQRLAGASTEPEALLLQLAYRAASPLPESSAPRESWPPVAAGAPEPPERRRRIKNPSKRR